MDGVDVVGVLPFDPRRQKIVLCLPFRVPGGLPSTRNAALLEVPSGRAGKESAAVAGRREVQQRTGLSVRVLQRVGAVCSGPGARPERVHLYYGLVDSEDAVGSGPASRGTGSLTLSYEQVIDLALHGGIRDLTTWALLMRAMVDGPLSSSARRLGTR